MDQITPAHHRLNSQIEQVYGEFAEDEIEILAGEFETNTTRMIEIIEIGLKTVKAIDLYDSHEFNPVILPFEILLLLEPHDVFLTTMGRKNGSWHVIYLSPVYETVDGVFDDQNSES